MAAAAAAGTRALALACPDLKAALSHGRSQQALQLALMQLYVEGGVAQGLLPKGACICVCVPHVGSRSKLVCVQHL